MTDDLLDVINDLTQQRIEHIQQHADDGTFIASHPISHPALLLWLEQAVTPSSNSDGGASVSARERNLIDSGALYQFVLICSAITDWCRIAGVELSREGATRGDHMVHNLRRWYIKYREQDRDDTFYLSEVRRWRREIQDRIDPPKKREITHPCPVCKLDEWVNADGDTVRHPLIATFRPGAGEDTVRIVCRSAVCQSVTEWRGEDAIRELGEEMDELQHAG